MNPILSVQEHCYIVTDLIRFEQCFSLQISWLALCQERIGDNSNGKLPDARRIGRTTLQQQRQLIITTRIKNESKNGFPSSNRYITASQSGLLSLIYILFTFCIIQMQEAFHTERNCPLEKFFYPDTRRLF